MNFYFIHLLFTKKGFSAVFLFFFLVVPIVNISYGGYFINDCSFRPMIPIWLVVLGCIQFVLVVILITLHLKWIWFLILKLIKK